MVTESLTNDQDSPPADRRFGCAFRRCVDAPRD